MRDLCHEFQAPGFSYDLKGLMGMKVQQLQQNNELSLCVMPILRKRTLFHLARQAVQTANHQGPLTKTDATALVDNTVTQMQQMVFANLFCPALVRDTMDRPRGLLLGTTALFHSGHLPSL